MRARNIKPGFFINEQLAECCFAARILFEGLWCLADRDGRLNDKPRKIKVLVFPYDDVDTEALLNELATNNLIVRYEVEGNQYIEIPTFLKHQKPHPKETKSVIPPSQVCTSSYLGNTQTIPRYEPTNTMDTSSPAESLNAESLNAESLNAESLKPAPKSCGGKQVELINDFSPEETAIVAAFSGVPDIKLTPVKLVQQFRDLQKEFPGVDGLSEAKKMALWLSEQSPAKRKKAVVLLFARNWIERAAKAPSPPYGSLSCGGRCKPPLNSDGSVGSLNPEEEAEQRALEEKYARQYGVQTGGEGVCT